MVKEWDNLELISGILYRVRRANGQTLHVCREDVLSSLHDQMGHLGWDRTMELVKSRFYWPGMYTSVERKVSSCGRCLRYKSKPDFAPLLSIHSHEPMELVCVDFLSLPASHPLSVCPSDNGPFYPLHASRGHQESDGPDNGQGAL